MSVSIAPTTTKYFFGRISRDEAEGELNQRGCPEGLYLLRESMTTAGNYALSICHQGRIHHYSIERQSDGTVMIQDGKRFVGPIELVQHHEKVLDGFLTKPTIPCERKPEQAPMAWPGVRMIELEQALQEKAGAMNLKGAQLENFLGPKRAYLVNMVAKELHKDQGWFHGKITREEADNAINNDGHIDGKFLVRERDDKSYALSLSYHSQTKHYKIEKHKSASGEKLAIEDGPRFDSLMDMIGHYHNKTDGLLCKLTCSCIRPGFKKRVRVPLSGTCEKNKIYGPLPGGPTGVAGSLLDQDASLPLRVEDGLDYADKDLPPRHPAPGMPVTPAGLRNIIKPPVMQPVRPPRLISKMNDPTVLAQGIIGNEHVTNAVWDDPDIPDVLSNSVQTGAEDDPQKIYDSLPMTDDMFKLKSRDLEMFEKLGAGNFGSVMRGIYQRNNQRIPVAIKTLKQDDVPNAESEIMKEARVMAGLQHRNIVRLIGVCRSDTIMLVMELAALGQLSKYLKKHSELPIKTAMELMFQVAEGMAYLESKNFVHRDLAARNVLLVNERFAKISDFGMSKALGFGNNYYQAETAGKWPLKWYAPECIYYFKFDSKSDVWSYGVTLWEALSYGAKPYKGLKGQQILELIENGGRLDKPEKCPPGVYEIMLRCWTYEKRDRPTFHDIVEALRKFK